jgi:hypothetical protein
MSLPHMLPCAVPRVATRPTWITTVSPSKLKLLASAMGMSVFAANLLLDATTLTGESPRWKLRTLAASAAGVATGLAVAKLLGEVRERRRSVISRLQMVDAMNHHIRNALQTIEFSACASADERAIAQIHQAVERIQWALCEVLPRRN